MAILCGVQAVAGLHIAVGVFNAFTAFSKSQVDAVGAAVIFFRPEGVALIAVGALVRLVGKSVVGLSEHGPDGGFSDTFNSAT